MVTGGAAMFLNDSLTRNKSLKTTFFHHEQACAMAGGNGFAVKTDEPQKDVQFPVAIADDDEPDAPSPAQTSHAPDFTATTVAVPELTSRRITD